jgi:anthranilate phosphoribosyltransferase
VGVADAAAIPRMAAVLHRLGVERAFVVGGEGLDELPLDGTGTIHDVTPNGIEVRTVDAAALGLTRAPHQRLAGGTPEENARIIESVLHGEPGARRDVVVLNAAAALVVAGVAATLEEGVERAALTIDAGLGTELLARLRAERQSADAARVEREGAPA